VLLDVLENCGGGHSRVPCLACARGMAFCVTEGGMSFSGARRRNFKGRLVPGERVDAVFAYNKTKSPAYGRAFGGGTHCPPGIANA
jgi:hypothetical protein